MKKILGGNTKIIVRRRPKGVIPLDRTERTVLAAVDVTSPGTDRARPRILVYLPYALLDVDVKGRSARHGVALRDQPVTRVYVTA